MPFVLPTKDIAWLYSLLNRCAYTTGVNQMMGDVMFTVFNNLITTRGFTCKGSSTGVVAAMDGVFRWASGNDAKTRATLAASPQSWVAITLGGGCGDIVATYTAAGDWGYDVFWSPSGVATVAATATHAPTATDKIQITSYFTGAMAPVISSATSGDRLVSVWANPNKKGFRVAIARLGAWESFWGMDEFTPDTYGAGITIKEVAPFYVAGAFNSSQNGAGWNLINANAAVSTSTEATMKRFAVRRTDGGGTTINEIAHKMKVTGDGTAGNQPFPNADQGFAPELQGGATYAMKRFGLYSRQASHRGDVGWLKDWYISRSAVADGDTAGSLEWICVESTGSMWWPWDGVTSVVMS